MTDTNERDRKAKEWCRDNQFASHKDRGVAFKDGWDACESSERVRGLVEALEKIAGPIQGSKLKGYGPSSSVQRRQIASEALAAWGEE